MSQSLPVVFVTHGGGPFPVLREDSLSRHLRALGKQVAATKPKAILMVSAHWEEKQATLISDSRPSLLYDYYGFPPESYSLKYDAPGDSALAASIQAMLRSHGLAAELKSGRGWDHGVFIPLLLMLPAADTPVVQLSLLSSLDAAAHIKLGRALEVLRDQGVFIIGSGSSFHNMRTFGGGFGDGSGSETSRDFHAWLHRAICDMPPAERAEALEGWQKAPSGPACHPREEHLLPLHVCVGAAGNDAGHVIFDGNLMGVQMACYMFGDWGSLAM